MPATKIVPSPEEVQKATERALLEIEAIQSVKDAAAEWGPKYTKPKSLIDPEEPELRIAANNFESTYPTHSHLRWTQKQVYFKHYYRLYRSPERAAAAAGFKTKWLAQIGKSLLRHPEMRAAIEEEDQIALKEMGIDPQAVLRELALIAFQDSKDIVNILKGRIEVKTGIEMGEATKILSEISETSTNQGTNVKVKPYSKLEALKLLMGSLGMIVSRSEVPGAESEDDIAALSPQARTRRINELIAKRGFRAPETPESGRGEDPLETPSR